eukprot:96576-Rhodomonas_salina.1
MDMVMVFVVVTATEMIMIMIMIDSHDVQRAKWHCIMLRDTEQTVWLQRPNATVHHPTPHIQHTDPTLTMTAPQGSLASRSPRPSQAKLMKETREFSVSGGMSPLHTARSRASARRPRSIHDEAVALAHLHTFVFTDGMETAIR